MELPTITNDQEHEAAVNLNITWNQAPDAAERRADIIALGERIEAYEEAQGHTPDQPKTLRGILELEMYKRRIRQRAMAELLGVSEPRLSELMKGRREMNLEFAKRLYTKLHIPAEVVLSLAG